MIKVIIFDWGDVISFFNREFYKEMGPKHFGASGGKFAAIELENRLRHDLGEISTEEFVANINKAFGKRFSVAEYYALLEKYGLEKLNETLVDIIRRLRKNYKIFLLSNNSKPTHNSLLESELRHLFDKILFSFQVGIKKPSERFFRMILEKTHFSPKECIFIDDRERNCEAAGRCGMKAIIFKNNEQLKRDLSALGVEV